MPVEGEKFSGQGTVTKILWPRPHELGRSDWRLFLLLLEDGTELKCSATFPALQEGHQLFVDGAWEFKKGSYTLAVSSYETIIPPTRQGVIGFLVMLKGVGQATAEAIYDKFGDRAIDVIEKEPSALLAVKGIGQKALDKIVESYAKLRGLERLIRFLAGVGIHSQTLPAKIYREFGAQSELAIRANPYQLAYSVDGIGFKTADQIARKLGVEPNGSVRLRAGLYFALREAGSLGHVFLPESELVSKTTEFLSDGTYVPSPEDLHRQIKALEQDSEAPLVIEDGRVYLKHLLKAEQQSARMIAQRLSVPHRLDFDVDAWMRQYEAGLQFPLSPLQREAAIKALQYKVFILTGGAGTGKSTVTDCIVKGWRKMGLTVLGAAPSGKAAKRLADCTGLPATTVHALLEFDGQVFNRDEQNPLLCDALVIDEVSMMDLFLLYRTLKALPPHAYLLLVGDPYQLPSIGAGAVLRDLIASGQIESVELTTVYRQSEGSMISYCANRIKDGKNPDFEILQPRVKPSTDALFYPCKPEEIPDAILNICKSYLPSLGFKPEDIYINSPQNKGNYGNHVFNKLLQDLWNPIDPKSGNTKKELSGFREGDRVLNTRNSKEKCFPDGKILVNGDQGIITRINPIDREIQVDFGGTVFEFADLEIQDLILAYSLSVHRCQGSEFPVVIIPATVSHYVMLQRNLFYTGVTRGKKMTIVVGEQRAISMAVNNNVANTRNTRLTQRIQKICDALKALYA